MYCIADINQNQVKARIKGVSGNSVVLSEQDVKKYKNVNNKNQLMSRTYTINEEKELYELYNTSKDMVCKNYLQIFNKLINNEPVYVLQQVFEKHGVDGNAVMNGAEVGIEHVLMIKKIQ